MRNQNWTQKTKISTWIFSRKSKFNLTKRLQQKSQETKQKINLCSKFYGNFYANWFRYQNWRSNRSNKLPNRNSNIEKTANEKRYRFFVKCQKNLKNYRNLSYPIFHSVSNRIFQLVFSYTWMIEDMKLEFSVYERYFVVFQGYLSFIFEISDFLETFLKFFMNRRGNGLNEWNFDVNAS